MRLEHESEPVRLWHLAAHVSGLPRVPDNLSLDLENPYEGYDEDLFRAYLARVELETTPGSRYEYSNVGYGLLGLLLEHLTGQSYSELVASRVAGPLSLRRTAVGTPDVWARDLAAPHAFGLPSLTWGAEDALFGAGCLSSSPLDTHALVEAFLRPDPDLPLSPALDECLQPRASLDSGGQIGLGWHQTSDGAFWHNGSTGGYHTMAIFDRSKDLALSLLANDVCPEVTELGFVVWETLMLKPSAELLPGDEPWATTLWTPVSLSQNEAHRWLGTYSDRESGTKLEISAIAHGPGPVLTAQLDDQPPFRIFPSKPKPGRLPRRGSDHRVRATSQWWAGNEPRT